MPDINIRPSSKKKLVLKKADSGTNSFVNPMTMNSNIKKVIPESTNSEILKTSTGFRRP